VTTRDGDANLYLLPLDGGEARPLTHISTGASDPVWSPDGKRIAFSSDVYPECADDACNKKIAETWQKGTLKAHIADALFYRHWTPWKDGTRTTFFSPMSPAPPERPRSHARQLRLAVVPARRPAASLRARQFRIVLRVEPRAAARQFHQQRSVAAVARGARTRGRETSRPATWHDGSPSTRRMARSGHRTQKQPGYESDLFRLALYDRRAGTSEVLTEAFRDWVSEFDWSPDSKSIDFQAEAPGETPIYRLDLASKRTVKLLADKTIDAWKSVPQKRQLVYSRRGVAEPAELFVIDLAGDKASTPRPLTHLNDDIAKEVDLRPVERMWIDGAAGSKIDVFIVKPHGFDPGRKYPLILNVHGGPQDQWRDAFRGDFQLYSGAGYVTAFANPHGSVGYGQDFTAKIWRDYGGAVFEDLMKVTDALEKLPYVDANRMGAMGWSFGGYMMNWFEGHTNRFKAIASMMGLYDLRSWYGSTEELWFPELDLKGSPWNSALYEKFRRRPP
jgi:dipeptidyl aminopeptidase/acylaminoacyl peptidase